MTIYVVDTEANGLLDELTHFHCLCFSPLKSNKYFVFCDVSKLSSKELIDFKAEGVEFFPTQHYIKLLNSSKTTGLICHNIFGYDLPAMEKLDDITFDHNSINGRKLEIIDSLVLSRYLNPERRLPRGCPTSIPNLTTGKKDKIGPHGLNCWGYRTGVAKPIVNDWNDQPLGVYINRVVEDVKINEAAYLMLQIEAADVAIPNGDIQGDWEKPLRMSQRVYHLMCKQERTGVLFDQDAAKDLVVRIDREMSEIEAEVEPILGERKLPAGKQPKFPANIWKMPFDYDNPWTKTGKLRKPVRDYLETLGYDSEDSQIEYIKSMYDVDEFGDPVNNIKRDIPRDSSLLTASAVAYCNKFGITEPDNMVVELNRIVNGGPGKMLTEVLKLKHKKDVKEFLIKDGWVPTIWKTRNILTNKLTKQSLTVDEVEVKYQKYMKEFEDSVYWPFILKDLGYKSGVADTSTQTFKNKVLKQGRGLMSSPQYKDQAGETCVNLKKLLGKTTKSIIRWLSLQNRRANIKSFNKDTGWLNHPRLAVDGRLPARASGITNTNRVKHSVICNIPAASDKVVLGKEVRGLFIAPEGYYCCGVDALGIEGRCAGNATYPFDNGAYAMEVLEGDIHQKNSEAFSRAAGRDISRSEGKPIYYGCLPIDTTTVLTTTGWKQYCDLAVGTEVLTYNIESDITEFNAIDNIYFYPDREIVNTANTFWNFESTPEHRWFGRVRREVGNGERAYKNEFFTTDQFKSEHNILNTAKYVGGSSDVTPDEAAVIAWILGDGSISWAKKTLKTSSSFGKKRGVIALITQSKNKYWREIESILHRLGWEYSKDEKPGYNNNGNTIYSWRLRPHNIRALWTKAGIPWGSVKTDFNWSSFVLGLSTKANKAFLQAWWEGEGHKSKGVNMITQNRNSLSESIVLSATLLGYKVTTTPKGPDGVCVDMRLSTNRYTTGQRIKRSRRIGDVFCISTKNGTFIARQKDHITITGNSLYGCQAKKAGAMLNAPPATGQLVIDSLWETYPGLRLLKEGLEQYWEATGKKYIMGVDGRKIFTRSKHSLLNSYLQSMGSCVMDWACCYMAEQIKQKSVAAERWVYYHDEVNHYIPKSDVKEYFFPIDQKPTEKRDGLIYSKPKIYRGGKVMHYISKEEDFQKGDQWIQWYSQLGEIAAEAITKAGEYFKFKVPMGGQYIIGDSWGTTH